MNRFQIAAAAFVVVAGGFCLMTYALCAAQAFIQWTPFVYPPGEMLRAWVVIGLFAAAVCAAIPD